MSISGYDLQGAADALGRWVAQAAREPRAAMPPRLAPERALYAPLLVAGNRVKVVLRDSPVVIEGELTALEDAGMVIAYADAEVLDAVGESILRAVPYASVLCVVELLPDAEASE